MQVTAVSVRSEAVVEEEGRCGRLSPTCLFIGEQYIESPVQTPINFFELHVVAAGVAWPGSRSRRKLELSCRFSMLLAATVLLSVELLLRAR